LAVDADVDVFLGIDAGYFLVFVPLSHYVRFELLPQLVTKDYCQRSSLVENETKLTTTEVILILNWRGDGDASVGGNEGASASVSASASVGVVVVAVVVVEGVLLVVAAAVGGERNCNG
jgi:hypothetical protein